MDNKYWEEIVDNVFYKNYVKGDPSKFLNALETILKKKKYEGPINPDRPDNFGWSTGLDLLKNKKALEGLENDRKNRPLDRYIMQDTLVKKFFKGDQDAAGKAYQEWLLSRGKIRKHHDSAGRDVFLIPKIEDVPIWTPNDDVVELPMYGFFVDYLFGGKHYKSYEEQDEKRKEDEDYKKNRAEKKYRDICNRCGGDAKMPWVSSDDDYPEGMIEKSEVCKRCNPEGEKPTKMGDWNYGYYCKICENPGFPGVLDESQYEYKNVIKDIEYWKNRLEQEEKQAERMVNNPEGYKTYLANLKGRPVNGENIEEAKQAIEKLEKRIYKDGQRCSCSFEKLKGVHDRYVQFEDYESLGNMKKNKLYNWFFEQLSKTKNLNECIERIKNIMKLL